MQETIERAKSGFVRAKDRMSKLLAATPDDRLNWSPSASSRTPVQLVAHSADAIRNIHAMMKGKVFEAATPEEAEKMFRPWEQQFKTRESAQKVLDENGGAFLAWLETVTPADLDRIIPLPFGMGEAPLGSVLHVAGDHTMAHVAQLEYLQTIYGDLDWHM